MLSSQVNVVAFQFSGDHYAVKVIGLMSIYIYVCVCVYKNNCNLART